MSVCGKRVLLSSFFLLACNANGVELKLAPTLSIEGSCGETVACSSMSWEKGKKEKPACCNINYGSKKFTGRLQQKLLEISRDGKEYWQADLPFEPNFFSPNPREPIWALGYSKEESRYVDRIIFVFLNERTILEYQDRFVDDGAVIHASWPRDSQNGIWSPGSGELVAFRPWDWGPIHIVDVKQLKEYLLHGEPIRKVLLTERKRTSMSPMLCGFVAWKSDKQLTFECSDELSIWSQEYSIDDNHYGEAECVQGTCLRTRKGRLEFYWNYVEIDGESTPGRAYNRAVVDSVIPAMVGLNECIVKYTTNVSGIIRIYWSRKIDGEKAEVLVPTVLASTSLLKSGSKIGKRMSLNSCLKETEKEIDSIDIPGVKEVNATLKVYPKKKLNP